MQVEAYAKLTLSLRVEGVRADGYHEIDALMTQVSEPHDTVWVEPAAAMSIEVTGPFAHGAPDGASNLAWRAAEAAGATVAIRLHKGIPAGAGLGGGSADAAAVLVALGADPAVGATVGADVPFCMHGGAARVRGIGDLVVATDIAPSWIVVATPRFGCATADVYRAWDALGGPHAEPNDLEPAAQHVEPRLVEFKQAVERAAGAPAILAGSGASYAVVFDDAAAAEQARARVAAAVDGTVWLATCPAGDVASGSS
jgi:4-diphosphocytidyl-2-C-methyl-D-erythritol kinase